MLGPVPIYPHKQLNGAEEYLEEHEIPIFPKQIVEMDDYATVADIKARKYYAEDLGLSNVAGRPVTPFTIYTDPPPQTNTTRTGIMLDPAECEFISDTTGEYNYIIYPMDTREPSLVARPIHPNCYYTSGRNTQGLRLTAFLFGKPI